jgi:hypothetical protein
MKKYLKIVSLIVPVGILMTACGPVDAPSNEEVDPNVENNNEVVMEEASRIAFADLDKGIMDVRKEFSVFRFEGMEGSCLDMGFPTNLVYKGSNMIMTEDEEYFDKGTMVDFSGKIRFKNLPLDSGNVNCVIDTTKGMNKAKFSCVLAEGEDLETEVCSLSANIWAEK